MADTYQHLIKPILFLFNIKGIFHEHLNLTADVLHRSWNEPCQIFRACYAFQELYKSLGEDDFIHTAFG